MFVDALIAGLCAVFQARHPDVRIEQSYGYFPDLRAALKAGQIDLAICPIDILDEGSGREFQQILPGCNVIACRAAHPLPFKHRLQPGHLLDYRWVAPPPGSPLPADLRALLFSCGVTEIKIRCSSDSLMGVINYLKSADALTVMPHSVVFSQRKDKTITALPISIQHPERAPSISSPPSCAQVSRSFATFIKRHEETVIWGR